MTMKKIIKLTESDLARIVKRVIKENSVKDDLIQSIKDEGWDNTAELVGGDKNLMKILNIDSPMDFLHLFDDLDIVQSEEKPDWTLFRHKPKKNLMIHNRKNNKVYINYDEIWEVLEDVFNLEYSEIQELIKEWLFEVYNLRGITPHASGCPL